MKVYEPLAVTGFSFCIALLCASLMPFDILLMVILPLGIVFLGAIIFFIVKGFSINRVIIAISLFLIFMAPVTNAGYRFYNAKVVSGFPETPVRITATVEEECYSNGFLVKTENVDIENFPQKIKIILYTSGTYALSEGEKFSCIIKGYRDMPSRSQQGKGAVMSGHIMGDYFLLEESPVEINIISQCRRALKSSIRKTVPYPYDSVLIAMLLGDSEEMNPQMYNSFNYTGVSHILCVSGLHITLIYGIFAAFFGLIFGRKQITDILSLFITFIFVIITGAGPSAVRAFVMATAMILSRHIIRNYSPLNTLGGVAITFCVFEPYIIYNNGFLMSVFAVFSLCTLASQWSNRIITKYSLTNRILIYIINLFIASLSVSICLIPIMMLSSGYTSLLSPIANLLIIPAVPFAMIIGIIASVTGIGLVGFLEAFILRYMHLVAEKLGNLPFATIPLNFKFIEGLVVAVIIIVVAASCLKKLKRYSTLIICICAVILVTGGLVNHLENRNVLNITVLESGDGKSTVLHKNNKSVIINCGGSSTIGRKTSQYLRSKGIYDIELILITTNKNEQGSGFFDLVSFGIPDETIYVPGGNHLYELENIVMTELSPLERTIFGDAVLKIDDEISITANGREFFLDSDNSFGMMLGEEKFILQKGKKEDTLEIKYDIMSTDDIKSLEEENFVMLQGGEALTMRVSQNGKVLLKG